MKYTLLFFLSSIFVQAQIQFEKSLDEAFSKAKEQHKTVFIEYYRKDCHACSLLESLLQNNSSFTTFYNQNFINYRIEISDEKHPDVMFLTEEKKLFFDATPMFVFFDEDRNFVHYASVQLSEPKLIDIGKIALNNEENTIGLEHKYDIGERSIKVLYNLSLLANIKKDKLKMNALNDELFAVFPKDNLSSTKSYIILKQCIISVENGFYKHWISHLDDLENLKDVKEIDLAARKKILLDIAINDINSNQNDWNLEKINWVKSFLPKLDNTLNTNDLFWENEMRLLVENHKITEAKELAYQLVEKEQFNKANCEYYLTKFKEFFPSKKDQKEIDKWFKN